ncbi:RNA-directed DNA polymerase from mobile element jockey-like [Rhizophagus irregularis DAOM 181602=DAOM 197198]|nr:RNA-directed DNA polymerase from mobile element jockey-like [Rhizophagus irregularis DAOM 181602=DAOM 197198]
MTLLLRSLLLFNEKEFQASSIQAKIDAQNDNFTNDISTFIESALLRTRRRIVLDQVFVDHPLHPTLLTFPDAIDQEVIEHFQNFVPITSTPPSSIQDLPEQWSNAYAPLTNVSPSIFDSLMDLPILDEWSSTISSMPNDKAPGLSMISYEMLKHLGPFASALLFNLICACLSDANIPDLWRQATVFPISKPHEWKCQLKNTRFITLLEVIRKALVKLFYNCLAPLLASHHVLQDGNFAGLPGGSCRDHIITLESIIYDSVVTKQPLWILSQDISKAFDSVDLSML